MVMKEQTSKRLNLRVIQKGTILGSLSAPLKKSNMNNAIPNLSSSYYDGNIVTIHVDDGTFFFGPFS